MNLSFPVNLGAKKSPKCIQDSDMGWSLSFAKELTSFIKGQSRLVSYFRQIINDYESSPDCHNRVSAELLKTSQGIRSECWFSEIIHDIFSCETGNMIPIHIILSLHSTKSSLCLSSFFVLIMAFFSFTSFFQV
jgi:hypothetical protein